MKCVSFERNPQILMRFRPFLVLFETAGHLAFRHPQVDLQTKVHTMTCWVIQHLPTHRGWCIQQLQLLSHLTSLVQWGRQKVVRKTEGLFKRPKSCHFTLFILSQGKRNCQRSANKKKKKKEKISQHRNNVWRMLWCSWYKQGVSWGNISVLNAVLRVNVMQ